MILASICARGGSKGIARKNLRELAGKPLMQWALESARAAGSVDRVVCSTDDQEIADLAKRLGIDIPAMRPAELSRDDSSKWPVFAHVVEVAEEHYGQRVEVLVDLDLGTPFRTGEDIEQCIDVVRETGVDVVTTGYPAVRNPYFNMTELDEDGHAHIVKQSPEPITFRQEAPTVYSLTPLVWAMTGDFARRGVHWTHGRLKIVEVPRERGLDVDGPVDLAFAEFLIERGILP